MKKKIFREIIISIACALLAVFPSFAQEVNNSVETSIAVKGDNIIYRICIINKQNELWACYGKNNRELLATDVAQVAKGGDCFLKTDGTLWVWTLVSKAEEWALWSSGDVYDYQCVASNLNEIPESYYYDVNSVKQKVSNYKKAVKTVGTTFVIKNDGSLWGWGDNSKAQMGNGLNCGTLVYNHWGVDQGQRDWYTVYCQVEEPVKIMEHVKAVFAAEASYDSQDGIYALKEDGSVWVWGDSRRIQTDETMTLIRGIDSGKEYPRLAEECFQGIKDLKIFVYSFNDINKYCYVKVNNDDTVWVKGEFGIDPVYNDFTLVYGEGLLGE